MHGEGTRKASTMKTLTSLQQCLALAITLPLATACGTDATAVGISVAALSGDGSPTLTAADASGTSFSITAGQLAVRDIEFDLPAGLSCADVADQLVGASCEATDDAAPDGEAKLIIDGPFIVDLVHRTAEPSLADVRIPAGTYGRVDVRVDPSAALGGASLVTDLAFDWGGTASTAALRLSFGEDIRTEVPGGVVVAEGDDLLARFVVDGWLAGADVIGCLEAVGAAPGDAATIDGSACGDVEAAVKDNFKNSADLVDDHGADDGTHDAGDDHGVDAPGTDDLGDDHGVDAPGTDDN